MIRNVLVMVVISLAVSIGFTGIASTALHARGRVTITNLSAEQRAVRPGARVRVRAASRDEAGGTLVYDWKADGRTVKGSGADTLVWKAPREEGRHRVSVTVANAAGSKAEASTVIIVSRYAELRPVRSSSRAARN